MARQTRVWGNLEACGEIAVLYSVDCVSLLCLSDFDWVLTFLRCDLLNVPVV
jgi:hypothetical protein